MSRDADEITGCDGTPSALLSDLLERAADGDDAAFAHLYDRTSGRLYGLILRIIRSPDLAQEVMQDVYTEIWRHAHRYRRDQGGVLSWMTTIAHRRTVDRVRSEASDAVRDQRYAQHTVERDRDVVTDSLETRWDVERVQHSLTTLTQRQREALSLAYFDGHTQREVATMLGLPLGTVKTRIRDGLQRLRDGLADQR